MSEATNRRPSFVLSVESRLLYERLAETPVGATVTYADLSSIIGSSVDGAHPHLQYARRRAQQLDRMVFKPVRGVGYKRLADAEIIGAAEESHNRIRRAARRAFRQTTCVDYDSLSNELRIRHNAHLSVFGAIAALSKPKNREKIENLVRQTERELPLSKTLEAFQRKG